MSRTGCGLQAMGQLYRDRADCDNGFDELKNHPTMALPRGAEVAVRADLRQVSDRVLRKASTSADFGFERKGVAFEP